MPAFKNLTGLRFGLLTVRAVVRTGSGRTCWACSCDCGGSSIVATHHLSSGATTSCGCHQKARAREATFKDLTGQRFGNLTAEAAVGRSGRATRWRCLCDCGRIAEVSIGHLKNGDTSSCGCLGGEKHGASQTKEYGTWSGIKKRCFNRSSQDFANYGGRGITMDERWRDSFSAFIADVGPAPSSKHSIDRIDNDGPYAPGNCRWALPVEQALNRRTNNVVEIGGVKKPLGVWAKQNGVEISTVKYRVRRGMPIERALTEPPDQRKQRFR